MKAEQAKQLADQSLQQLAAALDAGKSQALTAYLAALGRFHHYSFGNVLLIIMQKPDATHVAGFNAWKRLKRFVRKGEKGIVIIAPMLIRPKEARLDNSDLPEDPDRTFLRFKAVYVFDIAQTDGEPLPEFAVVQGSPNGHTERLKALIAEQRIALGYVESLGGAKGVSRGGRIELLAGLPPAEEFAVLVHELAHELLHRDERRTQTSKTVRETEAEAVAFVVCQAIGLDTGTAAADYIQLYAGSKETLAESLDAVQKTAAGIVAALLRDPHDEAD